MDSIVLINHVTKTFKNKHAVNQVTFSIKKGETVAILGPNGAGKTTTMMMMLGLLEPTSGEVRLFNSHPREKKIRERIGAMLQEVSVIDALKVKEIIQLFRSYYPNPMSFEELVTFTGLSEDDLKRRANKLSGGQKRRLGFALALAGDPDLVFLDEPTVGLDITSRKLFWRTIGELKTRGKTIIFTTHYLQEADDVADRIILFNDGTIVEDGTPSEIKGKLSKQSVSFIAGEEISIYELTQLPNVSDVYKKEDRIYVVTDHTDNTLAALFDRKFKISGIQIEQGRLDEAFEQLTENREAI
ncbi:ABC transporter ATP-binding protein [Cytobacillus sp. FJAT-53684]|uniref:ABC transporter ATP-binding protein n=1 Tax=Cytobacillus mangrovibacter TaxID=3299024 RepID=A0ABW6JUB1_9BACI